MIYTVAIIIHFLFDWVLQPRHVAEAKSIEVEVLLSHLYFQVVPYITIIFTLIYLLYDVNIYQLLYLWLGNIVTHIIIDWVLPKGKTMRQKINWTALDQMIHLGILCISIEILIS